MPSKLKTISVRLPDDVREWVEAQPGSAAGFVADLVTDRYLGPPEYMLKDEAARMTVPMASEMEVNVKLSAAEIEKTVFGEPTAAQLAFRKRMLAPKAKS